VIIGEWAAPNFPSWLLIGAIIDDSTEQVEIHSV
jgi:hypothetical protein